MSCDWLKAFLASLAVMLVTSTMHAADSRPNIVWFVVDDMSANFSCYGEKLIETPHVDRMAREGTRFTHAFVTAPVCSPSRSALITGMYQTTIGAHHHRSGRGVEKIYLPDGVTPVPALLKQAGYYTCIGGPLVAGKKGLGKTDYNFEWDSSMYDANDWRGRAPGQPFFMQVQLHGGKYRGGKKWEDEFRRVFGAGVKPAEVTLPPYYPRDPVLLEDWASYLDTCRYTDYEVGEVIKRLEAEGILDQTLLVFLTDHGISHSRGKQFLYDEGTHVPLVVRGPGVPHGKTRHDLVEHIDVAALTLAAAGVPLPSTMQARDILATDYQPREAVFAARDRCDETVEHLRSVRTERWLYIRNYLDQRPHLQPNNYKDGKAIVRRLRELHESKQLDEVAEQLLFAPQRPAEELYEWQVDRYQVNNLAGEVRYAETLTAMRQRLADWEASTGDRGRTPEPENMYASDMAEYLGEGKKSGPQRERLEQNIAQMRRWAAEGK